MEQHYDSIVNEGMVGSVKRRIHILLEKQHQNEIKNILELGAGSGEHKSFVKQKYSEYLETDIVQRKSQLENPNFLIANAEKLEEFDNDKFDRVIATCLLAHLNKPKDALSEWRRVTKDQGRIDIWVPCEPSLLLRFIRQFTTFYKARKLGLNPELMCYTDHRNHFLMLHHLILNEFRSDRITYVGFPFKKAPWDISLLRIYRIQVNKNA